ncbi:MAG: hypothetical protein AB1941_24355 [Gemmatimonadota bacterium]
MADEPARYGVWTTLEGGRNATGPEDVDRLLRRDSRSVFFTERPGAPALPDDGRASEVAHGTRLRLSGFGRGGRPLERHPHPHHRRVRRRAGMTTSLSAGGDDGPGAPREPGAPATSPAATAMAHARIREFLAGLSDSPTCPERIAAGIEELHPEAFRQMRDALLEHLVAAADTQPEPAEPVLALALRHLSAMQKAIAHLHFCLCREFAPPTWSLEDAAAADAQGWNIFWSDGAGHWQLQRDDAAGIFSDDDVAWRFVQGRASTGDPLAARALLFLRYACPEEYAAILDAARRPVPA